MKEILIEKGKTFSLEVRWGVEPWIYKPITGISLANGAPRLTVPGHGAPDKWPVAVILVKGTTQINAKDSPPGDDDFQEAWRIDADTIEFNGMDPTGLSAYTSGGFIVFKTPQDLTGYTARMDVKDKVDGTVLISSEADAAPNDVVDLTIDTANFVTTIGISATDAAAMAFKKGVTDLEMVGPTGTVTKLKLCSGKDEDPDPVRVVGEVTT
jgi:hypothetical protein